MVGQAQFSGNGRRCWGFSVFPDGKFDRRSRRKAPLWFRTMHSKYGLRGVRVEEASHPGPSASRYFALTEADTDAEDEDSNSHVSEVFLAETERSGEEKTGHSWRSDSGGSR